MKELHSKLESERRTRSRGAFLFLTLRAAVRSYRFYQFELSEKSTI
jgi:hypothetical protein